MSKSNDFSTIQSSQLANRLKARDEHPVYNSQNSSEESFFANENDVSNTVQFLILKHGAPSFNLILQSSFWKILFNEKVFSEKIHEICNLRLVNKRFAQYFIVPLFINLGLAGLISEYPPNCPFKKEQLYSKSINHRKNSGKDLRQCGVCKSFIDFYIKCTECERYYCWYESSASLDVTYKCGFGNSICLACSKSIYCDSCRMSYPICSKNLLKSSRVRIPYIKCCPENFFDISGNVFPIVQCKSCYDKIAVNSAEKCVECDSNLCPLRLGWLAAANCSVVCSYCNSHLCKSNECKLIHNSKPCINCGKCSICRISSERLCIRCNESIESDSYSSDESNGGFCSESESDEYVYLSKSSTSEDESGDEH